MKKSFLYLDPPYVKKSKDLYQNALTEKDHQILANTLKKLKYSWLVTYDNQIIIQTLYQDYFQQLFNIKYSLKNKINTQEIAIFSHHLYV
ncbi:DNA adenine methylase [Candidatus Phytoplasma pyri]|uniref:DNA adenine methylase n=1 Tax=Candidatus Phytoplasma pyri TaxID=47566 RepID=UPI003982E65F